MNHVLTFLRKQWAMAYKIVHDINLSFCDFIYVLCNTDWLRKYRTDTIIDTTYKHHDHAPHVDSCNKTQYDLFTVPYFGQDPSNHPNEHPPR